MENETTLHQIVDISRRLELIRRREREDREAKKTCSFRGFSGAYCRGKGCHGRGYVSCLVQSTLQVSHGDLA